MSVPAPLSSASTYSKPATPQRLGFITELRQYRRTERTGEDNFDFYHTKTEAFPLTMAATRGGIKGEDWGETLTPGRSDFRRKQVAVTFRSASKFNPNKLCGLFPPAINCSIPPVSYTPFRSQHMNRRNSTTPGKRMYQDHSIGGDGYNHPNAAKRLYKPQTIRLTARSKIVLHSSFPIQLPDRPAPRKESKAEKYRESPTPPPLGKSPERGLQLLHVPDSSDQVALTFGEKLIKVQKVAEASRYLA